MILRDLAGYIFLTLQQCCDIALHFDDLARNGLRRSRTNKAAAKCADQKSGAETCKIANTHEELLSR